MDAVEKHKHWNCRESNSDSSIRLHVAIHLGSREKKERNKRIKEGWKRNKGRK
jgi:hypothetical protein